MARLLFSEYSFGKRSDLRTVPDKVFSGDFALYKQPCSHPFLSFILCLRSLRPAFSRFLLTVFQNVSGLAIQLFADGFEGGETDGFGFPRF